MVLNFVLLLCLTSNNFFNIFFHFHVLWCFFVWSSSSFVTILQLQTMFVHHVDMFETSIPCLFVDDCFAIFTPSSFLNHAWSFDSCYELSFSTHIFNLPLHVISSSPWHNVMNWDLSRILTMFCVVCNHLSRHPCFPLPLHVLCLNSNTF